MKKLILAVVFIALCTIANAGGTKTATQWAFLYNDMDAFYSTYVQAGFGQDATDKAMLRDVQNGYCRVVPKGTRATVIEREGHICMVSVEGLDGFWFTFCGLFK